MRRRWIVMHWSGAGNGWRPAGLMEKDYGSLRMDGSVWPIAVFRSSIFPRPAPSRWPLPTGVCRSSSTGRFTTFVNCRRSSRRRVSRFVPNRIPRFFFSSTPGKGRACWLAYGECLPWRSGTAHGGSCSSRGIRTASNRSTRATTGGPSGLPPRLRRCSPAGESTHGPNRPATRAIFSGATCRSLTPCTAGSGLCPPAHG